MFDQASRYAKLPVKTLTDEIGREVAYVGRRVIPEVARMTIAAEIPVEAEDRLDLIANRAYGEPRVFWRVADANPTLEPESLTESPGAKLKIALITEG